MHRLITPTRRLSAAAALASVTLLATGGIAAAEPAVPPPPAAPIDISQAPALSAVSQLAPVVQQAAADPANASNLLMAAASAFGGNGAAPDSAKISEAVSRFVAQPAALGALLPTGLTGAGAAAPAATLGVPHVPPAGVVPGADNHLPTGVDPAHAVGPADSLAATAPAPEAAPALPEAVPAPAPEVMAAPTPAPDVVAAPAPAPEVPAPAPSPEVMAMPAPAPSPEVPVLTATTPDGAPAPAPAPDAAPAPAFGPDAPTTQEFMYPSIGNNCQKGGGNVLATALSVAGPAKIPTPGPGIGQTAYVFTAVGTPGPAAEQKLPLNVTWVNLTTGKSGTVTLRPQADINPQGPTTLTGIADTGSGSIMSTIFGQVTTLDAQCQFMPTIGSTVVP